MSLVKTQCQINNPGLCVHRMCPLASDVNKTANMDIEFSYSTAFQVQLLWTNAS